MPDRIHFAHLQRMLLDDAIPDEQLKPYLKVDLAASAPLGPRLLPDEATVELPEQRGIVGLSVALLNARAQRRRAANYARRIEGGWKGRRLLAEGDSWFEYPILLKDVIDHLEDDYAIYCASAAGDTLANMVAGLPEIERLIEQLKPEVFLFSGGGNDIAGEELVGNIIEAEPGRNRPEDFLDGGFQASLDRMKGHYRTLLSRLTQRFPDLAILCHGYDWPLPMRDGRWLQPALLQRKIPDEMQAPILRTMIDRYYALLHEVAGEFDGRVTVVDCRGVVGDRDQWFDELHPLDEGFARAAARFRDAIETRMAPAQVSVVAPPAPDCVTLTWYPSETSGVDRKPASRTLPVGTVVDIGRHPDRGIYLDDASVSRSHVRLKIGSDDIEFEDLNSTNGVWIDDERLKDGVWPHGRPMLIGTHVFEAAFVGRQDDTVVLPHKPFALARMDAGSGAVPLGTVKLSGRTEPALRPLEITAVHGNLANVSSPAYAIGVFENVGLRGAGRELNAVLQGNLTGLVQSQMFGTRPGEISILPTPRQRMMMEMIAIAGLGALQTFTHRVLHTVGHNLARLLSTARVNGVTTIPMGVDSGCSIGDFLRSFAGGFLEGLSSSDTARDVSRLQICEIDEARHREIVAELKRLVEEGYFASKGFSVMLREQHVGVQSVRSAEARSLERTVEPVYLQVSSPADGAFDYFVPQTELASVQSYMQRVAADRRAVLARKLAMTPAFDPALGAELTAFYVPVATQQTIVGCLGKSQNAHLVVIHDRASSSIPWEALYFGGSCPALASGISRIYRTAARDNVQARACLPRTALVRMLIVQNPTGDLSGAESEGRILAELFEANQGVVEVLRGPQATRPRIVETLSAKDYDILHYAGHADFDEQDSANSGLVCADGRLRAADIAGISHMPQLIFLNGCESGRMRGASRPINGSSLDQWKSNIGLAEGFLVNGLMNFIGTYWPVDDLGAARFARTFYTRLLSGEPIGQAVRSARTEIGEAGMRDWANYLHFGDPMYRIRQ